MKCLLNYRGSYVLILLCASQHTCWHKSIVQCRPEGRQDLGFSEGVLLACNTWKNSACITDAASRAGRRHSISRQTRWCLSCNGAAGRIARHAFTYQELLLSFTSPSIEQASGKCWGLTAPLAYAPHRALQDAAQAQCCAGKSTDCREAVQASGTTLGADNGIGVCAALALLDASQAAKLPPLECLFTVDEETGLTGAFQLDASMLSGAWRVLRASACVRLCKFGIRGRCVSAGRVDAEQCVASGRNSGRLCPTLIYLSSDLSGLSVGLSGCQGFSTCGDGESTGRAHHAEPGHRGLA